MAASFSVMSYSSNQLDCPVTSTQSVSSWSWHNVVYFPLSACSVPMENEVERVRVTLLRLFDSGSFVDVRVYLSDGALCSPLALTLMVEVQYGGRSTVLQQCALQGEGEKPGPRYCLYRCECAGPCSRLHLEFQSMLALGINNIDWAYCGVEICRP